MREGTGTRIYEVGCLKQAENSPRSRGLYDPRFEHDSCGVGFIARIDGVPTHDIIKNSIQVLFNLEHRGAVGADGATGDGAGLLVDMPDLFLRKAAADCGFDIPTRGDYAVAMLFLPRGAKERDACVAICEQTVTAEGCEVLGWRDVPVSNTHLGDLARKSQPGIRQLFIARGRIAPDSFERKLYVIRRVIEYAVSSRFPALGEQFSIVSMS